MNIIETPLPGLLVIEVQVFKDNRGFFLESYQQDRYTKAGISDTFVQENHSRSSYGVVRGMHFQIEHPQAQIVTVMSGAVFDVVVDLRPSSNSFGKWFGVHLSESSNARQVYMAPGLAHGFCVLSPFADLHYKVSRKYSPADEGGLLWCDEQVGIDWPIRNISVGSRDACFPRLKDLSFRSLPHV
jgi:dTDP-4-dehydrorhamnose 3,5-epimerase